MVPMATTLVGHPLMVRWPRSRRIEVSVSTVGRTSFGVYPIASDVQWLVSREKRSVRHLAVNRPEFFRLRWYVD